MHALGSARAIDQTAVKRVLSPQLPRRSRVERDRHAMRGTQRLRQSSTATRYPSRAPSGCRLSKLPPNQGLFPLNFPFWSLFYEVLWNIVYALVRRWLSTPLLAGTLCISALGLSAISVYNGSIDMGFSWGYRSFVGGSLRSFFGIFLGIFLHRLYERRILHRFVVGGVGVPLMVTTAVLVFPTLGGSADLAFELLAVALVFPACVYAGACASINSRASRVFAVLGFLSYPLYCLHAPASQIVRNFLDPSTTPHSVLVGSSFAVLLAIVCLAVDRFYERPVRKLLTGLAARMMAGYARQPG